MALVDVIAVICWALVANSDVVMMTSTHQHDRKTHHYDVAVKSVVVGNTSEIRVRSCTERVSSVEMCRDVVRYNATGWPNLIGHHSLLDAETQLRTFSPLVQYGCAKDQLLFFLCAVYVPMCTEKVVDVIGPCRPVCERVRQRCEPLLQNFGFVWPAAFNCARFPATNDDTHMCMDGPPVDDDQELDDVKQRSSSQRAHVAGNTANVERGDAGAKQLVPVTSTNDCALIHNQTDCRASCEVNRVVSMWLAGVASVCLVSTVFCTVTHVIDTQRSVYLERVVIYMSVCSGICAITVLSSVVLTSLSSVCGRYDELVSANSRCVVLFVVRYYFSLSCTMWWVVLNVVCLLTSALRWSEGELRRLTTLVQLLVWTVPALLVVVLLLRKDVELNVMSGLCQVTRGSVGQMALVITPLAVCTVVGLTVGTVTVVSSRLRQTYRQQNEDTKSTMLGVWLMSVMSGAVLVSFTIALLYQFKTHRYTADQNVTVLHTHSDSTAAILTVICPLLIGVVTVPWMIMSGRPSSCRTFVSSAD